MKEQNKAVKKVWLSNWNVLIVCNLQSSYAWRLLSYDQWKFGLVYGYCFSEKAFIIAFNKLLNCETVEKLLKSTKKFNISSYKHVHAVAMVAANRARARKYDIEILEIFRLILWFYRLFWKFKSLKLNSAMIETIVLWSTTWVLHLYDIV